jgi:predicted dehydrogenase/threonine dehydrogenase-like Zn-dependent dehydrogenase
MKQVLQNLKTGKTELLEEPLPRLKSGQVLIKTRASLISAGTERMLVEFGKAGYIAKARSQPDKVRQVIDKVRTDGLSATLRAVQSKLDQPIPLGYCNVGKVMEVGSGLEAKQFKAGMRVASNGPHAEVVSVPANLCARVPENVPDEEAAFTVVGAVALQGIRLAQPSLGECFVVTGLGLIGQIAVQLLTAQGCRVLGIDLDSAKCRLARQFGAEAVDLSAGEDPLQKAEAFSRSRGVDGVIITASTKSSEPVHQAAGMCRKRGRIVLVGVAGLELSRADFFEKELSFQVSCSYGPGRYDPVYEEKGLDYPIGFVRWTEQRNFEAVLDMLAAGRLNVRPLITHRFAFEEAEKAYELISGNREPYLGIILKYGTGQTVLGAGEHPEKDPQITPIAQIGERTIRLKDAVKDSQTASNLPVVGVIGAGNFTGQVLLPAVAKNEVRLKTIASGGGVSGSHFGRKFGFELSTTDTESVFSDPEINTVFVTTRHDSHARFVLEALRAGKHVFVEKPLCLTETELDEIKDIFLTLNTSNLKLPLLMVGFNRRFAPHVVKMKALLSTVPAPKSLIATVNAGEIPAGHWTQDPQAGGGRIVGEACHFIDLLRFLAGCPIAGSSIQVMAGKTGDTATIQLLFADGTIGTVHYFANGSRQFPKERIEAFCGGRVLQLDNFRMLRGWGWKGFGKMRTWSQDKGHAAEVKAFLDAVRGGGPAPIPPEEIFEVTSVSLEAAEQLRHQ